jgi:multicomponent K+:H+ antiporter subunit D
MLNHLPVLPVLIPLLAGIFLIFPFISKNTSRTRIASFIFSTILFIVTLTLFLLVQKQGIIIYALGDWQAPYGITLYVDVFSSLLCLLTSFLLLCVQLYSFGGEDIQGKHYHPLLMFQAMGIIGAFLTGDIFNLFVFFEVLLIASYALVIHGGGKQKTHANLHYVILNLAGSALFLFALGILYGTFGSLNIADMQSKVSLLNEDQAILAKAGGLLLIAVFGLKSALLPLHFWLSRTYASSPASVAALFAIMTKVGIYSFWRVHTGIFGHDAGSLANLAQDWIRPLAWLTLVAGTIAVLSSQSLRRLTANLVIVSVGCLLLMVAANTEMAATAGVYYLIHSTLACAMMFLITDLIIKQRGKAEDRFVVSRPVSQPRLLGLLYLFAALALIGMPPLSGFIGKALMLKASIEAESAILIWPPILISSLAAMIILTRAGSSIFWRAKGAAANNNHAQVSQLISVGMLGLALVLMVIFGGTLTQISSQAAENIFNLGGFFSSLEKVDA